MSTAVRIDGVFAGYGASDIVRDASFEVPNGQITTIAGPNGAGKSTLMKVIAGLLRPRLGRIRIGDRDITALGPAERAAAGLGYVPQEHNIFKNLGIGENLQIAFEFIRPRASAKEFKAARDRALALFPDLEGRLANVAGTLSGGQRQMLALGCALMPGPEALLLDEPSAGLSPKYVSEMLAAVRTVNAAGVTVLMIEQNVVEAVGVSHSVVLLAGGEVRGTWPANEFLSDSEVSKLFLGVKATAQARGAHGSGHH